VDKQIFIKSIWDFDDDDIMGVFSDLIDDGVKLKINYMIMTNTTRIIPYSEGNEEIMEASVESGLKPMIRLDFSRYGKYDKVIHRILDYCKLLRGYTIKKISPGMYSVQIHLIQSEGVKSHAVTTNQLREYFKDLEKLSYISYKKYYELDDKKSLMFIDGSKLSHNINLEFNTSTLNFNKLDKLWAIRNEFEKSLNKLKELESIEDINYNIFTDSTGNIIFTIKFIEVF
jgi:hypothetical protein